MIFQTLLLGKTFDDTVCILNHTKNWCKIKGEEGFPYIHICIVNLRAVINLFVGYSFLASHELSPQMISKGILSDADSGIAKRVINLYAANDGNTRKRGFTIVRLRDSDARKLICGLRLQDKELHYGGEIQLVATIPVGVQQMTSNKKATKSNGQMIIIFVSVGVVSLVAISTLIGLFVWWKRRKVYNYALGGQRDSFISCNSSDDEETEYQKK